MLGLWSKLVKKEKSIYNYWEHASASLKTGTWIVFLQSFCRRPTDSNKWKDNDLTADRELESDLNHLTWTVIHVLFDILTFKSSFSFIPHWVFYSSRSPFSLFLDKMLKLSELKRKWNIYSVSDEVSHLRSYSRSKKQKDRFRRQTLDIDQN